MSISLSSQLAALVYDECRHSSTLFDAFLFRPLGAGFDHGRVIDRLASIDVLRFSLSIHCQSKSCDYSADEAQNLFSMLDIAKSTLERIK